MSGGYPAVIGRLPVILQAERSECILACLAMILGFHGHSIDLNSLRNRCRVSQHGTTLKSAISLAARLDLVARPLRLELDDLAKLSLPAILHWDLDHFVVLKKISRRKLIIHNPASGCQTFSLQEAGKHFTGVAMELTPASDFEPRVEKCTLHFTELWKNTPGVVRGLCQLLLLSFLLQAFAISLPFYTQILIDDVLVSLDMELLKLVGAGFLALTIIRQLTELLRGYAVLYLSNRVSFQFATALCRHLLRLPQDYFSRRHLGDIVSRFGSIHQVRDFLCSGLVEIVIDGIMVVGALVLMWVYNATLTIIALAAVVLYGVLRMATYRQLHSRNEEWINDRASENTLFMENVSAIQAIKLFGREPSRLAAWQNRYATSISSGIRVQRLGLTVQFAHGLLLGLENILLLWIGCLAVINGSLTIGMLMAFVSFKDHFFRSVFSLLDKGFEFRLLDVHLGRLSDIAFCEPENIQSAAVPVLPEKQSCKIVLEDVGYRFAPDTPDLFSHISIELNADEIVAIIGPTGCGKSTLLKIAASLLPPVQGKLLFNGVEVSRANVEQYREGIAGVMQNDTLLSGSILENITFFDPVPDHDRVIEVAKTAMLLDDISRMPMQFHTMTGSMGAALSGGQVQRILLARALYKRPRLLVLDEATSHLDIHTEHGVSQGLRQLRIPCLMAAHRPETVLQADTIYRFEHGGLSLVSKHRFLEMLKAQTNNDVITT